jgi:hypothetical protein
MKNAEAYTHRSYLRMLRNDFAGAIADCSKAIEIDPAAFGSQQPGGCAGANG